MDQAFTVILFGGTIIVVIILNIVIKKNKPKRHILKAEKQIEDAVDSKDIHSLIRYIKNPDTEIPFEIKVAHRKKIIDGFRKIGLPAIESMVAILQDINSPDRPCR